MIATYLLDIGELPDPLEYEAGLNVLPEERIEKICRLKQRKARKQSFGAGLLLNYVMRRNTDGEIYYNHYGKPFSAHSAFNISHAGQYVIVSIACLPDRDGRTRMSGLYIGCDIEQIHDYNPKIAKRFFTQAEYQSLEQILDEKTRAEMFCRYWTRKESVLKLTGLGMSLPMDVFDVRNNRTAVLDSEKLCAFAKAAENKMHTEYRQAAELLSEAQLFFQEYSYEKCCITVCSTWNQFASDIQNVSGSILLQKNWKQEKV